MTSPQPVQRSLEEFALSICLDIRAIPRDPKYPHLTPQALIVGGNAFRAAQDERMTGKDIDVLALGVSPEHLVEHYRQATSAQRFERFVEYGNAFLVLEGVNSSGPSLHLSVPVRIDEKTKRYVKESVHPDPTLSFEAERIRVTFTVDAVGYDPVERREIDPFNGRSDFDQKVLRTRNPCFTLDPLNLYLALRKMTQQGYTPDADLDKTLRQMVVDPGDRTMFNFQSDRLAYEMGQLFCSPEAKPAMALDYFAEYGLIRRDFPVLDRLRWLDSGVEGVILWDKTLDVLDASFARDKTLDEKGRHASVLATLAAGVICGEERFGNSRVLTGPERKLTVVGLALQFVQNKFRKEVVEAVLGGLLEERYEQIR